MVVSPPIWILGGSFFTMTKALSRRVESARLIALTKVLPGATGLTLPAVSTRAIACEAVRQEKRAGRVMG